MNTHKSAGRQWNILPRGGATELSLLTPSSVAGGTWLCQCRMQWAGREPRTEQKGQLYCPYTSLSLALSSLAPPPIIASDLPPIPYLPSLPPDLDKQRQFPKLDLGAGARQGGSPLSAQCGRLSSLTAAEQGLSADPDTCHRSRGPLLPPLPSQLCRLLVTHFAVVGTAWPQDAWEVTASAGANSSESHLGPRPLPGIRNALHD